MLGLTAMVTRGLAQSSEPLPARLETIRSEAKLPSLSALIWRNGSILSHSALGLRKNGENIAVTTGDKYHIGSITKSMTATLAAMFVEDGKITWDARLGGHFIDLKSSMKPAWADVTLEQLLGHRAGAPHDVPPDLWAKCWQMEGPAPAHRMLLVRGTLEREPASSPGTRHIYSNTGYAIAGAMLERIAGKPWESLLQERLFKPLGMTSAGFGAPATLGKINQPYGHVLKEGKVQVIGTGKGGDNPQAIGPAGTVHCSLPDLARYAAFHLEGSKKDTAFLKRSSFVKLHTPLKDQDYAMGWGVSSRAWAKGTTLSHSGSNTMFFVNLWLAPEISTAIIAATNIGGDTAFQATDKAIGLLIKEHLK